jgi:hypothetical protein
LDNKNSGIFLNKISINSNLNVHNNIYSNNISTLNSLNVLNNVNITGQLYLQNNQIGNISTILSTLNVSGSTKIDNILTIPSLGLSIGSSTTSIYGNRINIGSSNSIINIIGSSTYVAVNDLYIQDKIYSLNINGSTYSAFDIGNNSGIELLGNTTVGFIKSSSDALRYQIKGPNDTNTNYILTQDSLNNLIISGTSMLKDNITLASASADLNIRLWNISKEIFYVVKIY